MKSEINMKKNINDGFSGTKNTQGVCKIKFEKVPEKEYLSLLENGSDELKSFKIPDSVTREEHVKIAYPDGKFQLQADLYYKNIKPTGKRPCIIFMHDWAGGDNPEICGDRQGCFFASNGFVFVTLYYRPPKYNPCPRS